MRRYLCTAPLSDRTLFIIDDAQVTLGNGTARTASSQPAHWAGHSRKQADCRFVAIRHPLRQLPLGDEAQLPFPTQDFGPKSTYKLFGVVTHTP